MDIYSYLNSKKVAEDLRKINYQFNTIGKAIIINTCRHISLEDKLRLFQEIIDTLPDVEISESTCVRNSGLEKRFKTFHSALAYHTETMRNSLNAFTTPEPDSIYSVEYCRIDWHDNIKCQKVYSTFTAAKEALMQELLDKKDDDPKLFIGYITKRRTDSDEYAYVEIHNSILTDLYDSKIEDVYEFFICFKVLMPGWNFPVRSHYRSLSRMSAKKRIDASDMTT